MSLGPEAKDGEFVNKKIKRGIDVQAPYTLRPPQLSRIANNVRPAVICYTYHDYYDDD